MEIDTFLICQAASPSPDGSWNLLRAGISQLEAKDFPTNGLVTIYTRISISPSELGQKEHRLQIRLMDQDGKDVLPQNLMVVFRTPPERNTSSDTHLTLTAQVAFQIPAPGPHDFVCLLDDHEQRRHQVNWRLPAEQKTG